MESYSAPLWKRKPIFFLSSLNSSLFRELTFCPSTLIVPSSAFSSPTMHLINTVLPEPDLPSTARFSPAARLKEIFFNTSCSPHPFHKLFISITRCLSALAFIISCPLFVLQSCQRLLSGEKI